MISIDFLKTSNSVAGLEFMNFQNDNFASKLTKVLDDHIKDGALDEIVKEHLPDIFKEFTGFENIKVNIVNYGNAAITAGYLNPNNVLNNQGLDKWWSHTNTTLYSFFTKNKENFFKGDVDYTTGKVEGSFSKMPLEMYINYNLGDFLTEKYLAKYNVTLGEALAGVIAHELGHAFSACMMMKDSCYTNVLAQSAVRLYKEAKNEKDRVIVVKDVGKLLEISKTNQKEIEEIAKAEDEGVFLLYYSKLLKQRNTNKALSLGVPTMTSEVLADAYALRMGFTRGILACVSDLTRGGFIERVAKPFVLINFSFLPLALLMTASGAMTAIPIMLATVSLFTTLGYLSGTSPDIYNTDPRRLGDLLRTSIMKIREDTNMSKKDKLELVNTLVKVREDVIKAEYLFDNTMVERFVGYIFHGGDYKKLNVEHFAEKLANHELNLLSHQLDNLA